MQVLFQPIIGQRYTADTEQFFSCNLLSNDIGISILS